MAESGGVPGRGRIHASIKKTFPASIVKASNLCEYGKIVESGRVPRNGRIRTSIEKQSRLVLEKVESVRVLKHCPGEYRKMVESV